MIPKFRAWKKVNSPEMFQDIAGIDFNENKIFVNYRISDSNTRLDIEQFENIVLMQSTGLFDGSLASVEIYKDDVVKRVSRIPEHPELVGVVKMLDGCWVIDEGKHAFPLGVLAESERNLVIGNIHEHPELVEGRNGMD